MDLGLTEIQKMLQESSRNFLEENCTMDFIRAMESDDIGITDEIWKNMSEMGWLGLMIPEGMVVQVLILMICQFYLKKWEE